MWVEPQVFLDHVLEPQCQKVSKEYLAGKPAAVMDIIVQRLTNFVGVEWPMLSGSDYLPEYIQPENIRF